MILLCAREVEHCVHGSQQVLEVKQKNSPVSGIADFDSRGF